MYRNFCKKKTGFTLIELLIVIGVLVVLLGILVPVFWQAREKSRRTACASNLHQLYEAFAMYAQDNDGRLPPYQNRIGNAVGCDSPSCGGPWKKPIPENGKQLVEVLFPYTKNRDIWFCPSDIFARTDAQDGGILHKYSSYRANEKLGQQLLFNEPFTLEGWNSVFGSSRHDTASVSLLTEDLFGLDCHIPNQVKPPYSHNQHFHTLYLDGHVKLWPWDVCERTAP
jgi:prepilin-type N-terminal cleavage/methylation domain-containing protein/prepilin-type processing-associated H-X9-DG protein